MMFTGAAKQGKIKLLSNGNVPASHKSIVLACSKSCHQASCDFSLRKPTSTRELILGLSDPSTHQCTIQKITHFGIVLDGMKLNPRQDLVPWGKFLCLFSSQQLTQQSVLTSLHPHHPLLSFLPLLSYLSKPFTLAYSHFSFSSFLLFESWFSWSPFFFLRGCLFIYF